MLCLTPDDAHVAGELLLEKLQAAHRVDLLRIHRLLTTVLLHFLQYNVYRDLLNFFLNKHSQHILNTVKYLF